MFSHLPIWCRVHEDGRSSVGWQMSISVLRIKSVLQCDGSPTIAQAPLGSLLDYGSASDSRSRTCSLLVRATPSANLEPERASRWMASHSSEDIRTDTWHVNHLSTSSGEGRRSSWTRLRGLILFAHLHCGCRSAAAAAAAATSSSPEDRRKLTGVQAQSDRLRPESPFSSSSSGSEVHS